MTKGVRVAHKISKVNKPKISSRMHRHRVPLVLRRAREVRQQHSMPVLCKLQATKMDKAMVLLA